MATRDFWMLPSQAERPAPPPAGSVACLRWIHGICTAAAAACLERGDVRTAPGRASNLAVGQHRHLCPSQAFVSLQLDRAVRFL